MGPVPLYSRLWALTPVWTGAQNLTSNRVWTTNLPAHMELLYRLCYLGPTAIYGNIKLNQMWFILYKHVLFGVLTKWRLWELLQTGMWCHVVWPLLTHYMVWHARRQQSSSHKTHQDSNNCTVKQTNPFNRLILQIAWYHSLQQISYILLMDLLKYNFICCFTWVGILCCFSVRK